MYVTGGGLCTEGQKSWLRRTPGMYLWVGRWVGVCVCGRNRALYRGSHRVEIPGRGVPPVCDGGLEEMGVCVTGRRAGWVCVRVRVRVRVYVCDLLRVLNAVRVGRFDLLEARTLGNLVVPSLCRRLQAFAGVRV